jgi:hypothetical protein
VIALEITAKDQPGRHAFAAGLVVQGNPNTLNGQRSPVTRRPFSGPPGSEISHYPDSPPRGPFDLGGPAGRLSGGLPPAARWGSKGYKRPWRRAASNSSTRTGADPAFDFGCRQDKNGERRGPRSGVASLIRHRWRRLTRLILRCANSHIILLFVNKTSNQKIAFLISRIKS